jgi:hypothetical protein
VARSDNKWAWEYRYKDPATGNNKSMYLSTEKFPTQVAAERYLEAFVLKLNSENPTLAILEPPFWTVSSRRRSCSKSSSAAPVTGVRVKAN